MLLFTVTYIFHKQRVSGLFNVSSCDAPALAGQL